MDLSRHQQRKNQNEITSTTQPVTLASCLESGCGTSQQQRPRARKSNLECQPPQEVAEDPNGGDSQRRPSKSVTLSQQPRTAREELVRFCSLSSVRGLPRILRSRSLGWRVLWVVAVSGFLILSLVFTVNLVTAYMQYHTVLEVNSLSYSKMVPFPSVTVCNLQPFSTEMIQRFISGSREGGMELIDQLRALKRHANHSLSFESLSVRSFLFQNWGLDTVREIGLKFHDFVLNGTCNFTFVRDNKLQQQQCNSEQDVRIVLNHNFFTCFMISAPPHIANLTQSLELDLYLDTEQMFSCDLEPDCTSSLFDLDDSVGAYVQVHPAQTYPRLDQLGVHVLPGTKSVIEIAESMSVKKLRDLPGKPCSSQRNLELHVGEVRQQPFAYDSASCRELQQQREILTRCKCIEPSLPHAPHQSSERFCAKLPNDGTQDAFFSAYKCASRLNFDASKLSRTQTEKCHTPCESVAFRTTAYQSLWPAKTNELDFFRLRLQGRPQLEQKFRKLAEAERLDSSGNSEAAQRILEAEDAEHLIRDNFLRLRVFRPSFGHFVAKEKLQISRDSLVSHIGGSLSLWGGLTIVTAVELMELVYYLCKRLMLTRLA